MVQGIRVADRSHAHAPGEVTSFSITYASGLVEGEILSAIISSIVIDDGAPSLVIDVVQLNSPLVDLTVSGGIAGNIYFVSTKVLTNLGQELEGAVKVVVGQAAP